MLVVLSELYSSFVKIPICNAVLLRDLFNDFKQMCHTVTQGIRTIKTFFKYKSATADTFITKNNYSVEC